MRGIGRCSTIPTPNRAQGVDGTPSRIVCRNRRPHGHHRRRGACSLSLKKSISDLRRDPESRKLRIITPCKRSKSTLGASSYPITIGSGLLTDRELLETQIPGRDLLIVTNTTVAKLYLAKLTGSFSQRRHCRMHFAGRRAAQNAADRRLGARCARRQQNESRCHGAGIGRRCRWGYRRVRRVLLPARHRLRAIADHAARAGRFLGRRQDRRESLGRQESHRRLLSAASRHRRHRYPLDPAGPGIEIGPCRGDQARRASGIRCCSLGWNSRFHSCWRGTPTL